MTRGRRTVYGKCGRCGRLMFQAPVPMQGWGNVHPACKEAYGRSEARQRGR